MIRWKGWQAPLLSELRPISPSATPNRRRGESCQLFRKSPAVSIQRKGCQKVTGCSVSFHKSKKILILLFWGDNPFTFFTFKPRVLQMQWSFLVIYTKTIFSNISLANKTTSPIQNGRYKIDLRCSHDLLIDTVSEVEHHQTAIPIPIHPNTNSQPGAAMANWWTPSQRWSTASPGSAPTLISARCDAADDVYGDGV